MSIFVLGVVALGGVIAAHAEYQDPADIYQTSFNNDKFIRFEWFLLISEFVILFSMTLTVFVFDALVVFQNLFMVLFTILSVFGIEKVNQAITNVEIFYEMESQNKARAAGWVMLTILNLVFTVLLAVKWDLMSSWAYDRQEKKRLQTCLPPVDQFAGNIQHAQNIQRIMQKAQGTPKTMKLFATYVPISSATDTNTTESNALPMQACTPVYCVDNNSNRPSPYHVGYQHETKTEAFQQAS